MQEVMGGARMIRIAREDFLADAASLLPERQRRITARQRRQQRQRIEGLRFVIGGIISGDFRHCLSECGGTSTLVAGAEQRFNRAHEALFPRRFRFRNPHIGVAPNFASAALPLSTSSKNHSGWLKLIASPQ